MSTMPADQLFEECVKDAQNHAQVLIHRGINRIMDEYEAQALDAVTSKERQRYHDLLIELRRHKMQLAQSFTTHFNELVLGDFKPGHDAGARARLPDKLQLMDEEALQEDVEVSQLIQLFEAKAEWEIRDLNSRMSALRGAQVPSATHNPLRPEFVARALQRAVHHLPVNFSDRTFMLKNFGTVMSQMLKESYGTFSSKLQARNIMPIQYGVRAAEHMPRPARPEIAAPMVSQAVARTNPATQVAPAARTKALDSSAANLLSAAQPKDTVSAGTTHLQAYRPEQIQRLLSGRPAEKPQTPVESQTTEGGPSSFFGSGATDALKLVLQQLRRAQNEQTLSQAQDNLIARFRSDLVNAAQSPSERLTVDVVAMMFDHILADVRLLLPVRSALAKLQVPVLALAFADASLFSSRSHPTRKFINRVASYSLGHTDEQDPHFLLFYSVVHHEVHKLAADESGSPEPYTQSLEHIDLVIQEISQQAKLESEGKVRVLERAEQRTVAHSAVLRQLEVLMDSVKVDDYLRDFLRARWSLVIADCILQQGEDAAEVAQLKQAASDLVWSVIPKQSSNDKQHLINDLPLLVKKIRDGLNRVEWTDFPLAEKQKFFGQLMTSQAKAMKAESASTKTSRKPSNTQTADKWQERVEGVWNTQINVDSETAMDEMVMDAIEKDAAALIDAEDVNSLSPKIIEELAEQAPKADTENGPMESHEATASVAKEESAAYTSAVAKPHMPPPGKSDVLNIDELEVGTWYEMKLHGQWQRVQLFWKSPKNLFYMFSSNIGGKSHSITRRAMEKLRADNNLRKVESESLIDRAVADVMASAGPR